MPSGHNEAVMKILDAFRDEVRHREAQQQHSLSITAAQRYTLRELRAYYSQLEEDETDLKSQVVRLEQAFRRPATAAIRRQLNTLRRNGVTGVPLIRALSELYHDHGLDERVSEERRKLEEESDSLPRIICSEALI
jgi:hypothetical protein